MPTEAESHLGRARNAVAGYSHIDHQVRQAKFIGEEKLKIGERQIDCFVTETDYDSASAGQSSARTRKLWIDKSRYLVLREIQQTRTKAPWGKTINTKMTYIFTFANLDNQVTEALFAFVPPEGAKEVAELRSSSGPVVTPRPAAPRPAAPSSSAFVGKDAIAFALKDLDGNQVDLQALNGKVVLLDFWASWCGPCVAEMPHIEKLHKDFKDQGLVVLGVNYNEELEVARAFIERKGYTFTNLLDEGRETSMRYGVSAIPQVFIIDRDGKIKWHARGYSSGKEIELRSAVEKILKGGDPPAPGSIRANVSVSPAEKGIEGVDPPASDATGGVSFTPAPRTVRSSRSVLNSEAIKKAHPHYPSEARQARVQGSVQVEITVSESGKVIEAKAVSGHPLLRDAAEQAAMQWEFDPSKISGATAGAPVKIQGILTFNFTMQ
jgi:TonB family protein